jgi:hypothetical protein
MTIEHVKRQPPTYNAVKWTGDNLEEVQDALNINIFHIDMNYFSQRLSVRDKLTNNQVATVPVGSWIISAPYNGPETNEFGFSLEVLDDESYLAQFIQPVVEPPVEVPAPTDPETPTT